MDKWKKYITENDSNLSIEEVDEKVWQNVYKATVPKKNSFTKKIKTAFQNFIQKHKINNNTHVGERGYSKIRWAYAFVFFAFIIVSCTYKVKSYDKYGEIVTFALPKKNYWSNPETNTRNLFNLFSRLISPSDSSAFLFVKWIKNNSEAEKIIGDLKETRGVSELVVTPVKFEFKESLFSSFLHKAFDIQITKAKPDITEVKNTIEVILNEKGLSSIDVQVDDNSRDILLSSKNIDQENKLIDSKNSVSNTNNIKDRVEVTNPVDTIKNPKAGLKQLEDPQWKKDLELMTELTNALHRDGLIDNKKTYNLEIKDGEFYINDKKQTRQVTDKYRKYFRNDNYTINNDGDDPKSTSNSNNILKDKQKTGMPELHMDMPEFDAVQYQKNLKLMTSLINGLHEDGLIDKNKPYTVQVKEGELYVNNKKQPKEVSDKFRKYFQSNNYGFIND